MIDGVYEVLGIFDRVDNDLDTMKYLSLTERDQELFSRAALSYRNEYEDKSPITPPQVLRLCRREDYCNRFMDDIPARSGKHD